MPNTKLLYAILALSVIAIFGGVGYLASKNQTEQSGKPVTPNPAETTQPSTPAPPQATQISADPIADWQMYENKEYGFGMEYPNDWLVEGNKDKVYFKRNIGQEEIKKKEIGHPLIILVENVPTNSVLDWFEREFSDRDKDLKPEKSLVRIGGLDAIKYSDPISIGGCDEDFAVVKSEKLFRFLRGGSTCDYYDELFSNIISTFQFTK